MQNGVFLHTKEDINTGCLRTPFLITLFKFTTSMTDDFQRGIIDPLHRQVTSIASLEWIKVPLPQIHMPCWEKVIVQSEHQCHLYRQFESQITSFKKQFERGHTVQSGDCWTGGPWRTFGAKQCNLTALQFFWMSKCIHPFINLQNPALRSLSVSSAGWDSGGALL